MNAGDREDVYNKRMRRELVVVIAVTGLILGAVVWCTPNDYYYPIDTDMTNTCRMPEVPDARLID